MARHSDQLLRDPDRAFEVWIGQIESGLGRIFVGNVLTPASPDGRGERSANILAEAHHLADLADRRTRSIMDHGRGDSGAVAAVFLVNVLDHLLAPLMLEIDV